jgi:hypothetical protein
VAKIARILKTDVMSDLSALAQILQSKGRGKDTILAHITPKEAERLKKAGGRGSRNPNTGLLEFDDQPAPVDTTPAPAPSAGDMGQVTVTAPATVSAPDVSSYGGYTAPTMASMAPAADISGFTPSQVGLPPAAGTGLDTSGVTTPVIPGPQLAQGAEDQLQPVDVTAQKMTLDPRFQQGYLDKLGLTGKDLLRLGLGGVGAVMGGLGARKSAQQIAAAQQEQQALAQPYQEAGRAMTGAAARGELTPASAQAYQAAQAQMQQQAAARGGVGVEQQAAQLEAFRQKLLESQYTYGLQVAQIGDNIALGAIRTGLQLDQYLNASTQNFYTNLAAIVAGGFGGQRGGTAI